MTNNQATLEIPALFRLGLLEKLARLGWLRSLVTVAVVGLHLVLSHSDYDLLERFAAGLCGAITLNVIWSYFARADHCLPVIEWVMLQLYVFFAMPVFFEGLDTQSASFHALSRSGAILEALLATDLFVIGLLVGWRIIQKRRTEPRSAAVPRVAPMVVLAYGLVSIAVSFLLLRYEWEIRMEWYRSVLHLLFSPLIAQMLLLFNLHRKPLDGSVRRRVWVFTGLMVIQGLFSGRLDYTLTPLLTAGVGLLAATRRIPRSLIFVSVAMLLIFNPAKLVYRDITGYRTPGFSTLTFKQMVDAWKNSIEQVWSGGERTRGSSLNKTAVRLNYLSINATVIDAVPKRVPHAMGKPWLAVPYSLVPRFLWPGKPNLTEITADAFNVRFGMTTWRIAERSTSAYPIVADGFWNLGWPGVILVGLLAGIFWKTIFLVWNSAGMLRYTLAFLLLIDSRAATAMPGLLIGVLQTTFACIVVVKTLEIATAVIRRPLA